jgi:hypothetical protein
MDEDIEKIYRRINQLMGRSLADYALIRITIGLIAAQSDDWRDVIDNVRLMADFNIESNVWNGTPEEKLEIVTEARRVIREGLDDLHAALLARERGESPLPLG